MAHGQNIISSIKLPGGATYEIHDAQAIHNIEQLGLSAALVFKGTKTTEAAITGLTSAKVGDVWLCTANNTEYVCITAVNGTANAKAWEKLGNIHDAASSTHKHTVTMSGTNEASTVTGYTIVPTVTTVAKKLSATAEAPTIGTGKESVLGANTTFTVSGGTAKTTNIKATASGVGVGANGTATAITGFGDHTTAAAITGLNTTTVKNPSVSTVTIPNVTKNEAVSASKISENSSVTASKISKNESKTATKISSYGSLPSWQATVTDGVLSFDWGAGSLPTGSDVTASLITASDVSASKVTASDVSASKVTLGTALNASSVTTEDVTVATGPKATANAITALGEFTTATALTGVKVTSQPTVTLSTGATAGTGVISVATGVNTISVTASGNNVEAVTSVSAGAPTINLNVGETGIDFVESATPSSTNAELRNGSAAAQKWTQGNTTVSTPTA